MAISSNPACWRRSITFSFAARLDLASHFFELRVERLSFGQDAFCLLDHDSRVERGLELHSALPQKSRVVHFPGFDASNVGPLTKADLAAHETPSVNQRPSASNSSTSLSAAPC
jgi:hypothetical protein